MLNAETPSGSGADGASEGAGELLASALAEIEVLRRQLDELRALLDQRSNDCDTLADLVSQMRQELESNARELTEFHLRERMTLRRRMARLLQRLLQIGKGGDSK